MTTAAPLMAPVYSIEQGQRKVGPPARLDAGGTLAIRRRLRAAESVKGLLTHASNMAAESCGFSRALIVSVSDHTLTAGAIGALSDLASDKLRRSVLAQPVPLPSRSPELDLIRAAEAGHLEAGHFAFPSTLNASVLRSSLSLENIAFGAVMPEDRVLALLAVDRSAPAVERADWERVQQFALLVSCALESLILRLRMQEFSAELRHLSESATALVREALEAPLALPTDFCASPSFAVGYAPTVSREQLGQMFTRRELTILEGLVAGRSNPEIAADLQVSRETVKKYAARVMRKLGASSRADAAVRYVRLTSAITG
ncbi:MAG: helix-turn-helix transcriptional regulator [Solirubrobacteraceae bacterium]